jgi:menaquinone-specific isochorismate synthase
MSAGPLASAPPSGLVAHTVRLESDAVDLLALAGDDGMLFVRAGSGLAARGEAVRIPLPHGLAAPGAAEAVRSVLAAIDVSDDVGLPGCGPIAMGALPFDRMAPGHLVVPATVVGRHPDGTSWVTTVGTGPAPRPRPMAVPAPAPTLPPDGFRLAAVVPHAEWRRMVEATVARIRDDGPEKVVLAREVAVEANRPIVVGDVLGRLQALYPTCTVFSVDNFVGATPELLVRRTGAAVRSHPLAGTIPRSGDAAADDQLAAALLGSAKERHEHRVVVDAVAATLAPLCEELTVPASPSLLRLRNVSHLGTAIEGVLRHPAPSALELAAELHPTPAVAGSPRHEALEHIAAVEHLDRGNYAGPVGWVDARGDGEWAVGIRSAHLSGARARLIAGVGVVADSDPAAELAETQLKLQALLAAVVRP